MSEQNDLISKVVTFCPEVTREKYAELTGLPEGVVRGIVERGDIPTVKRGRRRLINLAKITKDCIDSE